VQRAKDRQNVRFEGLFRNGHVLPAPETRGAAKWFQGSSTTTVPRSVTRIPAPFQPAGTIFRTAASSAVNRHSCSSLEEADMSRTVVDAADLERRVKDMYTQVALEPHAGYHFEMGRAMAARLGYTDEELGAAPAGSIESFAGVGYYFGLATLRPGEQVVDLGSGSGMDSFIAADKVGLNGRVTGIDMTDAQLAKADRLAKEHGFSSVEFRRALIDATGLPDGCCDVVISNGVINLSPDKAAVFREAARLLRPRGRLALADIVTEVPLPETVSCDATLWAACIGGAMQRNAYVEAIEGAGFTVTAMKSNDEYRFLSRSAQNATREYGVHSVSLLAIRS
jgi:ubiquinone/menaquinone biosynthesis C-methylase UbiE